MLPLAKRAAFVLALSLAVTPLHAADYTYQQTTQLTGGSLLHMMKSVGFMSSQARHMGDPVVSSIYLKDNRLANVSAESIEIIDLDKETITHVDVQKKTYTVMTFDQIKQAVANARAQLEKQQPTQPAAAQQPAADPNVKMSFDVKVRKTGAQKEISGLQSNEAILTMTMTATSTAPTTGDQPQPSGAMAITNDMWMVPAIPGYDQVRDFYKRMGEKLVDSNTIGLGYDFSKMLAQNPGAGAGSRRYGQGDAEAGWSAHHAGDAHGHHRERPAPAGCIRSAHTRRSGRADHRRRGKGRGQGRNDFSPHQPFGRTGRIWRFRQKEAAGPTTHPGSEPSPGAGSGIHIDGDANYHFELLVRTRRSFSFRHPGRLQAGATTNAGDSAACSINAERNVPNPRFLRRAPTNTGRFSCALL